MAEAASLNRSPGAPTLKSLGISAQRPLVVVDVDEVLGLFVAGFSRFLEGRGCELRLDRFALFENMYRAGAAEPLARPEGQLLFDEFFRERCGEMEPAPGAVEGLRRLSRRAEIIILSNAPAEAERLRRGWLKRHGIAHPLILNEGPKGPVMAALAHQSQGRSAFVDDLLPNLDSVAEHSPATATFQHVADLRLRPLAPSSPRHRRVDDWAELALAIEAAVMG